MLSVARNGGGIPLSFVCPKSATNTRMNPQCAYFCTIIVTDLEPIHPANQMAFWGRSDHWNRKVPDFGQKGTGNTEFGYRWCILQPYPWYHSGRSNSLSVDIIPVSVFMMKSKRPLFCRTHLVIPQKWTHRLNHAQTLSLVSRRVRARAAGERRFILVCAHAHAPIARSGVDGVNFSAKLIRLQKVRGMELQCERRQSLTVWKVLLYWACIEPENSHGI